MQSIPRTKEIREMSIAIENLQVRETVSHGRRLWHVPEYSPAGSAGEEMLIAATARRPAAEAAEVNQCGNEKQNQIDAHDGLMRVHDPRVNQRR